MTIRFKCPHCQKPLSVKDQFAGKKGTCPACKKGLTVPTPAPRPAPIDVEELAAAALTDQPPPARAAKAETKVDFACPFCDAHVQVDASLAGRQTPCPECRRIVKVPQLVKNEPKDWRRLDSRLPAGARRETEAAPEGAWGSSVATRGVSQEALLEAGVIAEEREPWTLRQKVLLGGGSAAAVFLLAAGFWITLSLSSQARQKRAIERALQAVGAPSSNPRLGWERDAAIHRAAGEFFLRTGKRDCVAKAREHFGTARAFLVQAKSLDRDLMLADLALAQVGMGGDGDDVDRGRRLGWDEAQKEATLTLGGINSLDIRADALRDVIRYLIAHQQARRANPLASHVSGSTGASTMRAAAGLELVRAGRTAAAQELVQHAMDAYRNPPPAPKPDDAKDPPGGDGEGKDNPKPEEAPPVKVTPSPWLVALCVALDRRSDLKELEGSDGGAWGIGHAVGLACRNEMDEARRRAGRLGAPLERLRAYVGIAAAIEGSPPDPSDLETAAALVEKDLNGDIPPGLLRRLLHLGLRANQTDRMATLARSIKDPDLRGWAQLEVLRAKLKATSGRADDAQANNFDKNRLAHALALEAVARHNARSDGSAPAVIATWDEKLQPFGHAGAALGLQDRSQ